MGPFLSPDLKLGEVSFWNPLTKTGRILDAETPDEYPFDLSVRCYPRLGDFGTVLLGAPHNDRKPKRAEKVMYELLVYGKLKRVSRFVFLSEWEAMLRELEKVPIYQLLKTVTVKGDPRPDPVTRSWITPVLAREVVVWSGRYLPELARALRDTKLTRYDKPRYQRLASSGEWVDCPCPLTNESHAQELR